ncbi:MAG: hypothetical protein HXM76_06770 [Mogibacterium diversum]|nr:hypothetical protein [Mogibacterium diversum]
MLTKKQFQTKYNLTKREVDGICDYYGIKKNKGQFQIPDDAVPVYIPDKRYVDKEFCLYLFVADAIRKKLILVPELFYSTDDEVRTVVRVMRDKGLLVRIEGRPEDSLEYQDYILGPEFAEWKRNATENFKLVKEILGIAVESSSKGVTSAVLEHYTSM